MAESLEHDSTSAIDDVLKSTFLALKYFKEAESVIEENVDLPVDEIISAANQLIQQQARMKAVTRAYRQAVEQIDEMEEIFDENLPDAQSAEPDDIPEGKIIFAQHLQESASASPATSSQGTSSYIRDLTQLLKPPQRNKRSNGGDLEVMEEGPTRLIDPISKKDIEFAVKNRICGHIYDRDSFTAYLTSARNPRCPYMGCVNRTTMTKDSVEEDLNTNAEIAKNKK